MIKRCLEELGSVYFLKPQVQFSRIKIKQEP